MRAGRHFLRAFHGVGRALSIFAGRGRWSPWGTFDHAFAGTSFTDRVEVPTLSTRPHTVVARGRWLCALAFAGVVLLSVGIGSFGDARPAFAADEVGTLVATLTGSSSFKVRLDAAGVLARMKDPRVLPALAHAANADESPVVRVVALRLLAKNPGGDVTVERARTAIRRGLNDPRTEVRAQAARSLAELVAFADDPPAAAPPPPPRERPASSGALLITVRSMGDKTGHARPEKRERMKSEVIGNLRRERNDSVGDLSAPEAVYIVDGSIARLEQRARAGDVETVCVVELILSRPARGIVLVASGEAAVQKPRSQVRTASREPLEMEAIDYAVKSAHENLARYLAHNR
jgi:hypothetical protein